VQDIIIGLLAILVGAVFCFRGYLAMRLVIPIWGAFAGFFLGAGLIAATGDDGFLRTGLSWLVGLGVALLFGMIAYLYYEVAVLLAMGSVGFVLGTSAMVALGIDWSWLIILVGVLAGIVLAVVAIIADLPMLLLVVLTALAGASAVVTGAMLLFGAVDSADFTQASITSQLDDDWWWYVSYLVLAVAGLVAQLQAISSIRSSMRDDLMNVMADLTRSVMRSAHGSPDEWITAHERAVGRTIAMHQEIRRAESFDLTTLSVALRQLRNLIISASG